MCGVFGYVGKEKKNLSGFILQGLSKLEYRGYDSAGIAILQGKKYKIIREVGELKNLKKKVGTKKLSGFIGIGHTRWATHGGVLVKNSHPHTDCKKEISVVHNGIIENFEKLKTELIKKGHKFSSDTDTEVVAHMVEAGLQKNIRFVEVVKRVFNKLEGLNAIVVASPQGDMVGFRKGSPLVAGKGKNGFFVSSDTPGLISETNEIIFLKENEGILLSVDEMKIIDAKTGKLKVPKIEKIEMEEVEQDKGNFKHFLLKEIYEQPEVIMRVSANNKKDIKEVSKLIKNARGTYFTACGTASYAGMAATYLFSEISKRHVNFSVGSEFPYFQDFLTNKSLLIAASQSGETMDTLEAVRAAKKYKSKVLALVNVPGSSLTRLADKTLLLKAGPEKAVLSTKAYIAKLATFLLLCFTIAGRYDKGKEILKETSKKMSKMLNKDFEETIKKLARKLYKKENIYVIGRGVNYPTALEGALKIKEASYIHAEGFAAGELKHGVIALIEKGVPCISIIANDRSKEAILSNTMEMKTRGGYIIGISPEDNKMFDYWIKVPDVKVASALVNVVPLQILAYHLTLLRGHNPDRPRNLAKSVTVK